MKNIRPLSPLGLIGPICYLLLAIGYSQAATQVTLTLTLTNHLGALTNGTHAITINGVTRTFTNNVSSAPGLFILGTNHQTRAFTNLFTQFALYPWAGPLTLRTNTTNSLKLTAPVNGTITFTCVGDWGEGSTASQTITEETVVSVPITTKSLQTRTNIASGLIEALQYATNKIGPTWVPFDSYVPKTNGYSTNQILQSPKLTNALNYGTAFGSPGPSNYSHHFAGGLADNDYAIAIGESSTTTARLGIALGAYASAGGTNTIAIGFGADAAAGTNGIVIGANSQIVGNKTMALGNGSAASYNDSIAIGNGVVTSRTNEIRLGGAQDVVIGGLLHVAGALSNNAVIIGGGTLTNVAGSFSGLTATLLQAFGGFLTNLTAAFSAATITNLQAKGGNLTNVAGAFSGLTATNLQAQSGNLTNVSGAYVGITATNLQALGGYDTNRNYDRGFATNLTLQGAGTVAAGANLALTASAVTTIADGANVPNFGSNAYCRLNGTVTAPWTLAGIAGDLRNGRQLIIENRTGFSVSILHESGLSATAGNRINCGQDWTLGQGGMATLIYDSTASRWKVQATRTAFPEQGTGYGALMMTTSNSLICAGATGVYTNIPGYDTTSTNNVYGAPSLGALTNLAAGYYRIGYHSSFLGANSITYEFAIFTNNVACNTISSKERTDVAARHRSTVGQGIIYLPANCRTETKVQDFGGGTTVYIHRSSLVLGTP